jgi:hypothetical protein
VITIIFDADGEPGNMGRLIDLDMANAIKYPLSETEMTERDTRTVSTAQSSSWVSER